MNKLIKGIIFSGALILGMSSLTFAKFTDLIDIGNYVKAIETLTEKGVINGYPDNTFRPDGKITRAEFVKMVVLNDKLVSKNSEYINLKDIDGHWAEEYICNAFENQIIKGYEDNTFRPNQPITYAEVASVLLNSLEIKEQKNDNLSWSENCIHLAGECGLLDGIATNDLLGINPARRDNVALMLWNKSNIEPNNSSTDFEDKENKDETNEKDKSEDKEKIPVESINTRELHLGIVTKNTIRKGETYVTIQNTNEVDEIKLYSKSVTPKVNSFIVYTLNKKGEMKLKKQLLLEEVENVSLFVKDVDKELVTIEGEEKLLDLDLEKYVLDGFEIELDEYNYYLLEVTENENNNYEFDFVEDIQRDKLKLEKEDYLCFDSDTEIALIIRGIEK